MPVITNKPDAISFNNTEIAFATKSNISLIKANCLFSIINRPTLVKVGTWFVKKRLVIKPLIKHTIFEQFCGGETLQDSQRVIDELAAVGVDTILDYGVEGKESEEDFDRTVEHVVAAIKHAKKQANISAVSSKITGLTKNDLLVKMSANEPLTATENLALENLQKRLHTLCSCAAQNDTAILFDAEESWMQAAIDALVTEMMEIYNRQKAVVYNTAQMYRHDRMAFLKESHKHAVANKYILGIKLVRGAYMEKERSRAKEKWYPSPIQVNKKATDRDFDAALAYCVQHVENIAFCSASHNEQSALYLCQLINERGLPKNHSHINFAQLFGMSDHISFNLAEAGYNVAKYLPYGPVKEVIPYLIRRAEENTSVAGQTGRELTLLQQEMKRRKLFPWL